MGYLLLAVLSTWPLGQHFTTALPGEGSDSWQYLWNFWWFDQALFHGQRLYFTPAQYYPGTLLYFHTLSPLHSVMGLPARLLLGRLVPGRYIAAYNSVVLLSVLLSGYGLYLLVRDSLEEEGPAGPATHLAAFLAGAILALSPYRSAHMLGHLSLLATWTFPLMALFCRRALRRPDWRPALGIALTWAAAVLIDWYYPLYLGMLAGFFCLWTAGEVLLRQREWRESLRGMRCIAGGFLLAALLLSPLLLPVLRAAPEATYLAESPEFSATYGADLVAFVTPSPLHPLWGRAFGRWSDGFAAGNTAEGVVYLGVVPLLIAALGFRRAGRERRFWVALAGLFGLLALGPTLKVLNHPLDLPLPYRLLAHLPIVRFTRVPSRYALLTQLALAVLAGLGLGGRLREKTGRPRFAATLSFLLLALVALDYAAVPYPLTPAEVPTLYHQLAQDPEPYALLEVPLQKPQTQWYDTDWMLYQTVHGKYSFRGYISRGDPLFPFTGAPLLRQFALLAPFGDITYDNYRDLAGTVLSHYRIGYIVLERDRLEEQGRLDDALELVQEVLGPVPPSYEDDTLLAYRIEWGPERPFLRLGQGWHEVERQAWGPFRWIERDRAEVFVVLPGESTVELTFQAVSFLHPRRLEVWAGKAPVATLEVAASLQPYRLQLRLPAGETRLEWRTDGYDIPAEVGAGKDPRAVSVGVSGLRLNVDR